MSAFHTPHTDLLHIFINQAIGRLNATLRFACIRIVTISKLLKGKGLFLCWSQTFLWVKREWNFSVRIHAGMFVKHTTLRRLCSSWASTEVQVLSTALPKTLGKACSANTIALTKHHEVCCWDCKELNTRRHCSDLTHQWKTSSKSTQSNAAK